MRATDAWLTMCWTNDGAQLNRDMPEIAFMLGTDGGEIWSDFYAIPKSAANKPAGYALLNFLMTPENAVKEHVANGTPTTDSRVLALLPAELTSNKIVYPDEAASDAAGIRCGGDADRSGPGRGHGALQVGLIALMRAACGTEEAQSGHCGRWQRRRDLAVPLS